LKKNTDAAPKPTRVSKAETSYVEKGKELVNKDYQNEPLQEELIEGGCVDRQRLDRKSAKQADDKFLVNKSANWS